MFALACGMLGEKWRVRAMSKYDKCGSAFAWKKKNGKIFCSEICRDAYDFVNNPPVLISCGTCGRENLSESEKCSGCGTLFNKNHVSPGVTMFISAVLLIGCLVLWRWADSSYKETMRLA